MRIQFRKKLRNKKYFQWFAWRPIHIDEHSDPPGPWVWWEWVERRAIGGWCAFYRDIDDVDKE
jgi:hypothetical protein